MLEKGSGKKINIGAGAFWFAEGWESLDNAPAEYNKPWKHEGKCWDSRLPDDAYDIVFSSHMLEHVPHFRMEKTIAEFNRIMTTGGTIRILVPSLRKYAEAYVNNDVSYFSGAKHYSNHMGIGASFLRMLISPGGQTLAISREMDEIFGGYAHLYSYDYEMLSTVLEKWGFGDIRECEPGQSQIEELRDFQHAESNGKRYDMKDPFVKDKSFLAEGSDGHFTGFDKTSTTQLVVEAKKISSVAYAFEKEYKFNKMSRFDNPIDKLKLKLIRFVCHAVDITYAFAKKTGMTSLLKLLLGKGK